MKLIRTLLLAGVASGALSTAINAADYYVQPVKPGAVAGTPLAAISLQAVTEPDGDEGTLDGDPVDNLNELGNTAGKWLKVGDDPTPTPTPAAAPAPAASQPTTSAQAAAPAAQATALPALTNVAQPTAAQTYPSFMTLLKSGVVKGGDRIFLLGGGHGSVLMKGYKFSSPVTIASMPGQTAQFDELHVYDSSNMIFRDFKVWATNASAGTIALIRTVGNTSDITFTNLDVRSVATSTNYVTWDLATWKANKRGGFLLSGIRISAIGNRVTGTRHAILSDADYARIENNIIDGFAGDAMRANGDFAVVRGNKVQNCFHIDANHDDGFQSFSSGPGGPGTGTVYNLTIENNKIFEWNTTATNPLRCALQGISMFDGMYENTVIRNNLVSVSQGHGITIAGSRKGLIVNNTVVNVNGTAGRYPWISVSYHKNGTPPTDTLVVNNIANRVKGYYTPTRNVVEKNNVTLSNYTTEFTAPTLRDYTLLPTAKAANTADKQYAPPADIAGTPRPKGTGPDAGAYESQ